MKKLYLLPLLTLTVFFQRHALAQVPYSSLMGDFGQPEQFISELTDVFYSATSRFGVTPSIPGLFNGDITDANWAVPAGTSSVITIDLMAKGEVGPNGLTYPGGNIYISFYSTSAAASISGQLQYADGSWAPMDGFINISPLAAAGYAVFQGTINGRNWLKAIQLTVTAQPDYAATVAKIEYHRFRSDYELLPNIVSKYWANKFYAPLLFQDGSNTNKAYITADGNAFFNGNIGIGTTSPSSKLAVNGAITAKIVRVTPTGWPDYVFEKGYRLPGLEELQNFIAQHKHLPGIQTADKVETEGLDLGANQAAQLKKIEELTLYIIAMNKKIDDLAKENRQLKEMISHINSKIK